MRSHVSSSPRAATRLLSGALSLTIGATTCLPLHAAFAAPAEPTEPTEPTTPTTDDAAEAEAATPEVQAGGNVALLTFEGNGVIADMIRYKTLEGLEQSGFTVTAVKRSLSQAAKKVKCKSVDDACLAKISKYLVKNTRKELAFYAYGTVGENGVTSSIVLYDVAKGTVAKEINFIFDDGDFIASETLAERVGNAAVRAQVPRPAMSEAEAAIIAQLDEPLKTAEEAAAEAAKLKEAEEASLVVFNRSLDAGAQTVNLKKDFDDICREGPREDKELELPDGTVEVERDLRPACKRGAFWGYWQPRGYAVLSLTVLGVAATAGLYGGALAARSKWSDASSDLSNSGLVGSNPATAIQYSELAKEVASSGQRVRNLAIAGDIALGATALIGGLLVLTVIQDRDAARDYLQREKELNISNLHVSPIVSPGRGTYGFGAGFSF